MNYDDDLADFIRAGARSAQTFAELVAQAAGAYPLKVLRVAQKLGINLPMGPSEHLRTQLGPAIHPLDYDWRFGATTVARMRSLLQQEAASVALICCPSIATEVVGTRTALVDRNAAWKQWIDPQVEFAATDVGEHPQSWRGAFDAVLLDPPWYPAEFHRGIRTAAMIVRRGGIVFVSWPGAGTRPGLSSERATFLAHAKALGLALSSTEIGGLAYATPFFEGAALRASGLPVLAEWRRADLMRFVRDNANGDSNSPEPTDGIAAQSSAWDGGELGHFPVRLHRERSESVDPRLVSLVDGDVLRSVSRRDPARVAARVWTAGNRIFGCDRPDLVAAILRGRASDPILEVQCTIGRALSSDESRFVEEAMVQIRRLEAIEASEYDLLHGISDRTDESREFSAGVRKE